MVTDFFGKELNVGDKILRTGDKHFVEGVIVSFKTKKRWGRDIDMVGIKSKSRWNKELNKRTGYTYSSRLIKIEIN